MRERDFAEEQKKEKAGELGRERVSTREERCEKKIREREGVGLRETGRMKEVIQKNGKKKKKNRGREFTKMEMEGGGRTGRRKCKSEGEIFRREPIRERLCTR